MTTLLLSAAAVGLLVLAVQRLALHVALRRPIRAPRERAPVSILKPLCGLDDALEANLTSFLAVAGPRDEVLLGVKDSTDGAFPLACALAQRDLRFRVVIQRSTPGLNPKVNQLVTLAREAKHALLLISDSNARLPVGAIDELVALFEDDVRVGCVTNPVSGAGHQSFGALLDNLHLASGIGAAQLGAKTLVGKDLVVGKSMALRRAALDSLGGFTRYADVLAEDYVTGQDLRRGGWSIRVAQSPVWNVATHKSVRAFFERSLRWGVIHRTAVSLPTSLAQGLLNPLPFLLVALACSPSSRLLVTFVTAWLCKSALDASAAKALRCESTGWRTVPAVLVKDLILFVTWSHGLFARSVEWRGTRLKVGARSRLIHHLGARDVSPRTSL